MHPNPSVPRRILIVAPGADPIGSGRQLEIVVTTLLETGWDVWLATTTSGGSVSERVATRGVHARRVGRRPGPDAAAFMRLIRLCRGVRPAVMLGWGRSQTPAAAAAAFACGTRLVCRLDSPPRRTLVRLGVRQAARVIAASATTGAACERLGVDPARITIVAPAAHPAAAAGFTRAEVAARLGLDPEKQWTLSVAPLVAESRLDRLLWAIDQLGVVHRKLEHVLVGAGPWRQRLLRRARVQQLAERLHVFPHLDCLPDLLRQSRLVWQSGETACGGAILDGMALGIPAVAVAGDAARQLIVDGLTGRIVPALPESEFPRRALGILEDDAIAAGYGAAARERAAMEFPADRMVAGMLAAIEDR